jgi:hypothetical protein
MVQEKQRISSIPDISEGMTVKVITSFLLSVTFIISIRKDGLPI